MTQMFDLIEDYDRNLCLFVNCTGIYLKSISVYLVTLMMLTATALPHHGYRKGQQRCEKCVCEVCLFATARQGLRRSD